MPITCRENLMIAPDQLIAHPENPKTHKDYDIGQLAQFIKAQGFIAPIIIDEKDNILAGHKRCLAALKIELPEVPCVKIYGLTDDEKLAYVIADNKHTENSSWDNDLLGQSLRKIGENVDLKLLGFDTDKLKKFDIDLDEPDFNPNLPDNEMPRDDVDFDDDKNTKIIIPFFIYDRFKKEVERRIEHIVKMVDSTNSETILWEGMLDRLEAEDEKSIIG